MNMKSNKTGLKLYNAAIKRKEGLNPPKVNLISPLLDVATWYSNWLPAQFASLTALRAYFVADWVGRIIRHNGGTFHLVAVSAQANLHLVEVDTPPRGSFCLEVAPFVSGDEKSLPAPADQHFGLDVVRYYAISTNYRTPLQWNRAGLEAAQAALARLREYATRFENQKSATPSVAVLPKVANPDVPTEGEWRDRFYSSLNDDLNVTRALAVIWTLLQTLLADASKLSLLREFDQLLGLRLTSFYEQDSQNQTRNVPLRPVKAAKPAPFKPLPLNPKTAPPGQAARRVISSTREVRSLLDEPDKFDFTVSLLAYQNLAALRQTLESVLHYAARSPKQVEIIVANLGDEAGLTAYLEGQAARYANLRLVYASPERFLGEGAGRNIALRQGRGKYLLLLDAGLVLQGDIFEAFNTALEKAKRPGLYGLYSLELLRQDGKIVGSQPQGGVAQTGPHEAEALDGACLCFRRNLVGEAGFLDERFRYPFVLDLDYSFAFKDKKLPVVALPQLTALVQRPASSSTRPVWGLSPEEVVHQTQRNWQLFLKSWNLPGSGS